jgi:hypothetical protein
VKQGSKDECEGGGGEGGGGEGGGGKVVTVMVVAAMVMVVVNVLATSVWEARCGEHKLRLKYQLSKGEFRNHTSFFPDHISLTSFPF